MNFETLMNCQYVTSYGVAIKIDVFSYSRLFVRLHIQLLRTQQSNKVLIWDIYGAGRGFSLTALTMNTAEIA